MHPAKFDSPWSFKVSASRPPPPGGDGMRGTSHDACVWVGRGLMCPPAQAPSGDAHPH